MQYLDLVMQYLVMHLTYPIIWGNVILSGLITSSSLYPIKYLIDLFVPNGSFFETNILSTSIHLS